MTSRHYILTILLTLTSLLGMAQPRLRTPEMYIGAHAGVMASTVLFNPQNSPIDYLQSPLTPNAGLVFRYAGHRVCAIQVELNYMARGWHEQWQDLAGAFYPYTRRLDYIELPLLMHLYFGKQRFRGFFNLGPQIGYCFRDTHQGQANSTMQQHLAIDNPFDWGLAGGLGCYYRTRRAGLFQLEARFNFSLGTLYSNRTIDYFSQSNAMNLSINLAYMWEIKIK